MSTLDYISLDEVKTLPDLLLERVRRSPDSTAYKQYEKNKGVWIEKNWTETASDVGKWQAALKGENFQKGDRVAIMLRNSMEWAFFDQAALASGLAVVPLYINDNPGNIAYILNHSEAKLLLVENSEAWENLKEVHDKLETIERVVLIQPSDNASSDGRLRYLDKWLPQGEFGIEPQNINPDDPATIVYTSGTTGMPKGVILSHRNILWNASAGARSVDVYREDIFLSFLPMSHMLERSIGYILPIVTGSTVCYAQSVKTLAEDLITIKPTMLISVPLIYQRVYDKIQGKLAHASPVKKAMFAIAIDIGWKHFLYKQKREGWSPSLLLWPVLNHLVGKKVMDGFGGRLRVAISGGAPMPYDAARLFISLGLNLLQGYGMTESSPVISVNRTENNYPESIGPPLPEVEIKIDGNGEILTKNPGIMLGYWKNKEATDEVIDADGWLHTGDVGKFEDGRLYITDRLKQIIVMSNGRKIPPADIENRISSIQLFDNAVVVGENRPCLILLAQLNIENWQELAKKYGLDAENKESYRNKKVMEHALETVNGKLTDMPVYAKIKKVLFIGDTWTVENGLLTPTLKTKRKKIVDRYKNEIDSLYAEKGNAQPA